MAGSRGKTFYVFECEVDGCTAEFYLNDIPVIRRGNEIGRFYKGQSNELVRDGINEIAVIVHPGKTPAEAIAGDGGKRRQIASDKASVSAALAVYPFGAVAGGPDRTELFGLAWKGRSDGIPEIFPKVLGIQHDLGPLFGPWAWESLPPLTLDEGERTEIRKFLEPLHLSLAAGDPELFIEESRMRLDDTARAYGLPPGQKEDLIRQVTRRDAAQPWWGMQPLAPDTFNLRLCGGNRLVQLIGNDWMPVLKENPDEEDGVGTYSMMIGKVDGKWHIIR